MPRVEYQPVRIASCQVSLRIGEPGQNRAAAAAAITEAAALGARIVVLPELTPSGYVFRDLAEARSLSEPADGPTAADWRNLAARHGMVIIGGFSELGEDGLLYNSAMLVDPSGVAPSTARRTCGTPRPTSSLPAISRRRWSAQATARSR